MTNRKREYLIEILQAFENQADIAIKSARRVREALQASADGKAIRECCDLEFAISSLNGWIRKLPQSRILNRTCSQCIFFSEEFNCKKADSYTLGNADACDYFAERKGDQQ